MKKLIYLIMAIVVLGLIASGCLPVVPPTEQSEPTSLTRGPDETYYVATDGSDAYGDGTETWVDNDSSGGWTSGDTGPWLTISYAISQVLSDDTIIVKAGTYSEGIITIDKNLTIIGATGKPIINPTTNTGTANAIGPTGRGWFQIHNGATVTFNNLVFNGTGKNVFTAVHYHGDSAGGTVENCEFMNIQHSLYQGRGINNYGQYVEVIDCTFTNIQRIGVFTFNPTADTLIKGCTYTGKGDGDWLDYAFEAGNGGTVAIANCDVSNCLGVASVDGSISAGILITTYYGLGTNATVTCCNITNCTDGIAVGYNADDTSTVIANYNNITGNTYGIYNTSSTQIVDALYNWWGDATGPFHATTNTSGDGDAVSDNVNYDPWSFTPDPCEAKTLGFWKNHQGSVTAIFVEYDNPILGEYTVLNESEALGILKNAKAKNANEMLAAQLLAAELNKLHLVHIGFDALCFDDPIEDADEFLTEQSYVYPDPPTPDKADKKEAIDLKNALDEINNDGCGECVCEWD
jgi:hypothetical protein